MTAPFRPFYATLATQLNRGASRAALGLLGFRSDPLREHLRSLFEGAPGTGHSFLADPVFEAMFGWKPANKTLGQLSGNLLEPSLVAALSQPPKSLAEEYAFPVDRQPYRHQLESWQALLELSPPRSVLVSSGTGSGKTECFLIPILNDLAREANNHLGPLVGVRALFLYPLNALIKSQRDRLTAWSEPFKGKIRYCLYNGETRHVSPRRNMREWDCEVMGRDELRGNPPPILVTNATMLEYMLVRTDDRPILQQSQGLLRWIVIDEAHNYIGSQAAELTLLLRRVLHAFGRRAEDVHFIATSATIADSGEETKATLREFLADIAGVGIDRVHVVLGGREVPSLSKSLSRLNKPHLGLAALRSLSPQQRYETLATDPRIRQIRERLINQAELSSNLAQLAFGSDTETARRDTLELLDLCSQAWVETPKGQMEPFLPLRGHFFQRAQDGLWACANNACSGRKDTLLDDPKWPFGKLFFERRQHCDAEGCSSPVFELVQCGACGTEYLSAVEISDQGVDKLKPKLHRQDEDEFQQELEYTEDDEPEEKDGADDDSERGIPRLLGAADSQYGAKMELLPDHCLENWTGKRGIPVHLHLPDDEGLLVCVCCKERDRTGRHLFKPVRLGGPFLLQTASPVLLGHMKPFGKIDRVLPWEGRRLISFTDSRQGTARFAAKLQQEAERNYIRSLLYHTTADRARPADAGGKDKLEREIAALEPLAQSNPVIGDMLNQKRQELEKLSSPPLGRIGWGEAINMLLATDGFTKLLLPPLQEQSFGLGNQSLAELCLWREFLFRPKRQFSMEGLGLLRLEYKGLNGITLVPPILAQRSVKIEEWRELLQVTMDFIIRGRTSVAIPRDMMRWIGYPGNPTTVIPPGQEKRRGQVTWPSSRTATSRRARLVRLLAYAFHLNLEKEIDQAVIEEMLLAIWRAILPLLSATENSYHLNLGLQAEIMEVREAWACPVTRRLLPVTFRGITPYLSESSDKSLAECTKFSLPKLEKPFWNETEPDEREHWLENEPAIQALRERGLWADLNDRIVGFSPYFRSVEHSAQIPGTQLTQREKKFKKGEINLLSCSTTMEMGVDIGGLLGVAMNNAPPHPANFLQRAGRAGRRGETAAISFTLCKSTPHGEAVFKNPLWAFTTALGVPKVSLQSQRIIQRHVNALGLAAFLATRAPDDILHLRTGWFFEPHGENQSAPWAVFQDWLAKATEDERLFQGVETLLRRTCLEGRPVVEVLAQAATMVGQVQEEWQNELGALLSNLEDVKTPGGDSKPEKAILLQLERMRREYLLGELANRGFLPGYGFPTGVVSFLTTTLEDFNQGQPNNPAEREDNRVRRAGSPSRDLALAIRDYAPGTDTVLDGRVYRSGGVTLNWQVPAGAEAGPEIQLLRWVWRCQSCGSTGTRPTMPETCPHCGEVDSESLTRYEYLQPAGFAVDIRCKPHNDITTPQYIPVRDPLISLAGAAWLALPTAILGRCRASSRGALFHRTDGLHGKGYVLCLRCGMADSMLADARNPLPQNKHLPRSFVDEQGNFIHKRLRGGRDIEHNEQECPGNGTWAIKQGIRLGLETYTDVFELRLQALAGLDDVSKKKRTAYSLAVALRRALARQLGIEEREIGCVVQACRDSSGTGMSIYLYDTASDGAGYSTQAPHFLPALFKGAKEALECPRECDVACQACLLTYDTQHHLDDLDRNAALALLDEAFLDALELPVSLQAFGPATQLEMEPLGLALRRELQSHTANELRIFLGGDVKRWEPLAWRLRDELLNIKETDIVLRVILPRSSLDSLDEAQRGELAALLAVAGAEVHISPGLEMRGNLPLVLNIGHDQGSTLLACSLADALAPSPLWGSGELGAQFVRFNNSQTLPPIPGHWTHLQADNLRPSTEKMTELCIGTELNVSRKDFGSKAWRLLSEKASALKARLEAGTSLVEVAYTDRYLRSPLAVILLYEWITALTRFPGGLANHTALTIATSQIERNDLFDPRWLHQDWRDRTHRQLAFNVLFKPFGQFNFSEKANADLPHARVLRLKWSDRAIWEIRLDQGMGYWRTGLRHPFPFDQCEDKQLAAIKSASPILEAGNSLHPTYWYVFQNQ